MAREKKLKSVITSFTPDGDFLAILSPDGTVKIWNTSDQSLLAEWKGSDGDKDTSYSCMACSFVGKKRRKERATCLLALGTIDGNILVINFLSGELKWKSSRYHPGGIAGLSFANKGRSLHIVSANGMASICNSENGELIEEFKASKKLVSSVAFSQDEKTLAVVGSKIRLLSLESGKELLKFPDDLEPVQRIWISNNANTLVTRGVGEKHLQVWNCDLNSRTVNKGPVISMKHPPVVLECKNWNGDDSSVILSVSGSGIAYLWNLKTTSGKEFNPTRVMVKTKEAEADQQHSGRTKKSRGSIITARLNALESDGLVTALVTYGSTNSPQFNLLEISNPGEDIVLAAADEVVKTVAEGGRENGILVGKDDLQLEGAAEPTQNKKANKKRAASDLDLAVAENTFDIGHGEALDGVQIDDDWNEPTMGEKLENLNLLDNDDEAKTKENQDSSLQTMPPSADSVHVLLKQALNADDRTLLLDCLYTQDEKVIANSVSVLNPSHVLKLLSSLISIIESRGAILVCSLPWLRSLLLQHASGIMSQESSLIALNSLFQLIESRVTTFRPALQLQSCLDLLYAVVGDDWSDENDKITPIIYEDKDDSDEEEESEDAMEVDVNNEEVEAFSGVSDFEGSEGMSD